MIAFRFLKPGLPLATQIESHGAKAIGNRLIANPKHGLSPSTPSTKVVPFNVQGTSPIPPVTLGSGSSVLAESTLAL